MTNLMTSDWYDEQKVLILTEHSKITYNVSHKSFLALTIYERGKQQQRNVTVYKIFCNSQLFTV